MRTYKGFSVETLKRFGVTVGDGGVIIPYYRHDGTVYRKKGQRHDGGTYWLGDSKPQIPYGLETLKLGGGICFLAEGESCSWALRVAYPNIPVLGIPGAQSWRPEWAGPLRRFKRVFLMFDADKAGRKLREKVLEDVPLGRIVRWPEGMDTRDVLQHPDMGRPYCSAGILEAETELDRGLAVKDGDHVDNWLRRYLWLQAQGVGALREAEVI